MVNSFIEIYVKFILGLSIIPTQIIFSAASVVLLCKKDKWWKYLIKGLIGYLFIFITTLTMYTLIDLPYDGSIITYLGTPHFLMLLFLVIYTIVFEKREVNHQITIASIYFCLFYAITMFAGWVGTAQDEEWHFDTNFQFTLWISLFLMIGTSVFMVFFDIHKFERFPSYCKYLGLSFTIFMVVTFSILRVYVNPYSTASHNYMIIVYAAYIVLTFLMYILFYLLAKEYQNKLDAMVLYETHKNGENLMRISQDNYESIRKIRHDIKNQYAMMSILLEEEKYDELKGYFEQYTTKIKDVLNYSNCGNKILDNLINLEKDKAKKERIKIETRIAVPPALPFCNADMCSLITNLLDNAIEEVRKQKEENRKIQVVMSMQQAYFFLQVVNPIIKGEKIDLRTTKKDTFSHGYGLKIINNIALKYKGSMNVKIDEDSFSVSVLLSMMDGDKDE